MTRTLFTWLLLCGAAWAQVPGKIIETLADVPPQLRQPNWSAVKNGQGSCVNASTITLLRWLGLEEHAAWWRQSFEGGEWHGSHIQHMQSSGLKFAYTLEGDVAFLEWACRNRLGAGIFVDGGAHAINLADLTPEYAVLLDNNHPEAFYYVSRDEFIQDWLGASGFAWTFIYTPPPPWPR